MEATLFVKLAALGAIVVAFVAVILMSPKIWGGASGLPANSAESDAQAPTATAQGQASGKGADRAA